MKYLTAAIIISFVFILGTYAQNKEQTISGTDNIVYNIKYNLNHYHKIISEDDSIMDAANTNHNLTETAYKDGKALLLVQYVDIYGPTISADYYFNNNQLIFIEIKNKDNSTERSYFNDNKLIACFKNENEVDRNSEYFKTVETSAIPAAEWLIKRFANK